MLYIDADDSLGALLKELAAEARRPLHVFRQREDALGALHAQQTPYAIAVVGSTLADTDGLDLIDNIRQIDAHSTLPIAFVMPERDLELARKALHLGATEIFLETDHPALASMVRSCFNPQATGEFRGRVLVVEDSQLHAQHIASLSQELGFDVDACTTTEEGNALLAEHDYALALIDVVLGGMQSGLSLVRSIRAQPGTSADTPIIVMSGFNDAARRIEALRSGADDYLDKPFADEEFFWRVRRVIPMNSPARVPTNLPPDFDAMQVDWLRYGLSQREMDVCGGLVRGLSDRKISQELGVSFWTVRTHVSSIFAKLQLLNRRELLTRYLPNR